MKYIFFSLAVVASLAVTAQYKPVDQGSAVKFSVNNFGFAVGGTFTGLRGSIVFDPQHVADGSFDVSIDAITVNTDNSLRDSHLKKDGYFDVANYPRIQLVSSGLAAGDKAGMYVFTGQLSMKGKTKAVSFPFTVAPVEGGFTFKGSFTINRKDFGIGGTSTISNEVKLELNVVVVKQ
jgi:polyisoprenoid-binding protein YceI